LSHQEAYKILGVVRKEAGDLITEFYEETNQVWNEFTLLCNLHSGDYHPLHADNEKKDANGKWIPNHTPWRNYSVMLYLNTCEKDFQGGHINFPIIRQDIAPQEGLLMGFRSDHNFLHETTPVTEGNRFAVSLWMTSDKDHVENWNDSSQITPLTMQEKEPDRQ
jgi:predicted 2-oxoglutarate/Fe(II)-dependent dioxygenase YbiX